MAELNWNQCTAFGGNLEALQTLNTVIMAIQRFGHLPVNYLSDGSPIYLSHFVNNEYLYVNTMPQMPHSYVGYPLPADFDWRRINENRRRHNRRRRNINHQRRKTLAWKKIDDIDKECVKNRSEKKAPPVKQREESGSPSASVAVALSKNTASNKLLSEVKAKPISQSSQNTSLSLHHCASNSVPEAKKSDPPEGNPLNMDVKKPVSLSRKKRNRKRRNINKMKKRALMLKAEEAKGLASEGSSATEGPLPNQNLESKNSTKGLIPPIQQIEGQSSDQSQESIGKVKEQSLHSCPGEERLSMNPKIESLSINKEHCLKLSPGKEVLSKENLTIPVGKEVDTIKENIQSKSLTKGQLFSLSSGKDGTNNAKVKSTLLDSESKIRGPIAIPPVNKMPSINSWTKTEETKNRPRFRKSNEISRTKYINPFAYNSTVPKNSCPKQESSLLESVSSIETTLKDSPSIDLASQRNNKINVPNNSAVYKCSSVEIKTGKKKTKPNINQLHVPTSMSKERRTMKWCDSLYSSRGENPPKRAWIDPASPHKDATTTSASDIKGSSKRAWMDHTNPSRGLPAHCPLDKTDSSRKEGIDPARTSKEKNFSHDSGIDVKSSRLNKESKISFEVQIPPKISGKDSIKTSHSIVTNVAKESLNKCSSDKVTPRKEPIITEMMKKYFCSSEFSQESSPSLTQYTESSIQNPRCSLHYLEKSASSENTQRQYPNISEEPNSSLAIEKRNPSERPHKESSRSGKSSHISGTSEQNDSMKKMGWETVSFAKGQNIENTLFKEDFYEGHYVSNLVAHKTLPTDVKYEMKSSSKRTNSAKVSDKSNRLEKKVSSTRSEIVPARAANRSGKSDSLVKKDSSRRPQKELVSTAKESSKAGALDKKDSSIRPKIASASNSKGSSKSDYFDKKDSSKSTKEETKHTMNGSCRTASLDKKDAYIRQENRPECTPKVASKSGNSSEKDSTVRPPTVPTSASKEASKSGSSDKKDSSDRKISASDPNESARSGNLDKDFFIKPKIEAAIVDKVASKSVSFTKKSSSKRLQDETASAAKVSFQSSSLDKKDSSIRPQIVPESAANVSSKSDSLGKKGSCKRRHVETASATKRSSKSGSLDKKDSSKRPPVEPNNNEEGLSKSASIEKMDSSKKSQVELTISAEKLPKKYSSVMEECTTKPCLKPDSNAQEGIVNSSFQNGKSERPYAFPSIIDVGFPASNISENKDSSIRTRLEHAITANQQSENVSNQKESFGRQQKDIANIAKELSTQSTSDKIHKIKKSSTSTNTSTSTIAVRAAEDQHKQYLDKKSAKRPYENSAITSKKLSAQDTSDKKDSSKRLDVGTESATKVTIKSNSSGKVTTKRPRLETANSDKGKTEKSGRKESFERPYLRAASTVKDHPSPDISDKKDSSQTHPDHPSPDISDKKLSPQTLLLESVNVAEEHPKQCTSDKDSFKRPTEVLVSSSEGQTKQNSSDELVFPKMQKEELENITKVEFPNPISDKNVSKRSRIESEITIKKESSSHTLEKGDFSKRSRWDSYISSKKKFSIGASKIDEQLLGQDIEALRSSKCPRRSIESETTMKKESSSNILGKRNYSEGLKWDSDVSPKKKTASGASKIEEQLLGTNIEAPRSSKCPPKSVSSQKEASSKRTGNEVPVFSDTNSEAKGSKQRLEESRPLSTIEYIKETSQSSGTSMEGKINEGTSLSLDSSANMELNKIPVILSGKKYNQRPRRFYPPIVVPTLKTESNFEEQTSSSSSVNKGSFSKPVIESVLVSTSSTSESKLCMPHSRFQSNTICIPSVEEATNVFSDNCSSTEYQKIPVLLSNMKCNLKRDTTSELRQDCWRGVQQAPVAPISFKAEDPSGKLPSPYPIGESSMLFGKSQNEYTCTSSRTDFVSENGYYKKHSAAMVPVITVIKPTAIERALDVIPVITVIQPTDIENSPKVCKSPEPEAPLIPNFKKECEGECEKWELQHESLDDAVLDSLDTLCEIIDEYILLK